MPAAGSEGEGRHLDADLCAAAASAPALDRERRRAGDRWPFSVAIPARVMRHGSLRAPRSLVGQLDCGGRSNKASSAASGAWKDTVHSSRWARLIG